MSEMNTNKKVEDNSIRIFGIDGLLIALIVGLCIVGVAALKFRSDILMGYIFPIILLGIVLTVTINYAMTLGGFIRMQKEQLAQKKVDELEKPSE